MKKNYIPELLIYSFLVVLYVVGLVIITVQLANPSKEWATLLSGFMGLTGGVLGALAVFYTTLRIIAEERDKYITDKQQKEFDKLLLDTNTTINSLKNYFIEINEVESNLYYQFIYYLGNFMQGKYYSTFSEETRKYRELEYKINFEMKVFKMYINQFQDEDLNALYLSLQKKSSRGEVRKKLSLWQKNMLNFKIDTRSIILKKVLELKEKNNNNWFLSLEKLIEIQESIFEINDRRKAKQTE